MSNLCTTSSTLWMALTERLRSVSLRILVCGALWQLFSHSVLNNCGGSPCSSESSFIFSALTVSNSRFCDHPVVLFQCTVAFWFSLLLLLPFNSLFLSLLLGSFKSPVCYSSLTLTFFSQLCFYVKKKKSKRCQVPQFWVLFLNIQLLCEITVKQNTKL